MITENYIEFDGGKIYTKRYSCGSDKVLYLSTGNNIGSRALWDFKTPHNKTHAEILCYEFGIDVVLIDVIGYGSSIGWKHGFEYDRNYYAKQIVEVAKAYSPQYRKNVLFGYCSTTAQTIIASTSGLFDSVIIHSPGIMEPTKTFGDEVFHAKRCFWKQLPLTPKQIKILTDGSKSAGYRDLINDRFVCSISGMYNNRIKKVTEKLIPESNLFSNYIESMEDVVQSFTNNDDNPDIWYAPLGMVEDFMGYYTRVGNRGYDCKNSKIPKLYTLLGEYDYEATGKYYSMGDISVSEKFEELFAPKIVNRQTIKNGTHFTVWESCYLDTLKYLQECVLDS